MKTYVIEVYRPINRGGGTGFLTNDGLAIDCSYSTEKAQKYEGMEAVLLAVQNLRSPYAHGSVRIPPGVRLRLWEVEKKTQWVQSSRSPVE